MGAGGGIPGPLERPRDKASASRLAGEAANTMLTGGAHRTATQPRRIPSARIRSRGDPSQRPHGPPDARWCVTSRPVGSIGGCSSSAGGIEADEDEPSSGPAPTGGAASAGLSSEASATRERSLAAAATRGGPCAGGASRTGDTALRISHIERGPASAGLLSEASATRGRSLAAAATRGGPCAGGGKLPGASRTGDAAFWTSHVSSTLPRTPWR